MKLSDLVEDADSECLDLGPDGSSSEGEEYEDEGDTEIFPRLFTLVQMGLCQKIIFCLKTL